MVWVTSHHPSTLRSCKTQASLTVWSHVSRLSSEECEYLLMTWAHLLFQDLPDLEDVDTGESLEDQDEVITQVFPTISIIPLSLPVSFTKCTFLIRK